MRWLSYFILAYLMLGLQLGIGGHVRIGGAAPNLILLAAIFLAINAPRDAALIGCFVLGLLQDMLTAHTLGLYALSYGIVGMLITSSQHVMFRQHPLAHAMLGLVGAGITSIVLLIHGWLHPAGGISIGTLFAMTLYTTLLAPIVMGLLHRMRGIFAFQPARRTRAPGGFALSR